MDWRSLIERTACHWKRQSAKPYKRPTGRFVMAPVSRWRRAGKASSRIEWLAYLLSCSSDVKKKLVACLEFGLIDRMCAYAKNMDLSSLSRPEQVRYLTLSGRADNAITLLSRFTTDLGFCLRMTDKEIDDLASQAVRARPEIAWSLVSRCAARPDSFLAYALASRGKDFAMEVLNAGPLNQSNPDNLLLSSNLLENGEQRVQRVNHYLAHYGLSSIGLRNEARPLSISNLCSAPSRRSATHSGPLLSVIMTGHNVAGYVESAIESVLEQTYTSLELIFVDDASTDETASKVRSLANRDKRLKLVNLFENSGTYSAKNSALDFASGEFITFHDADDWCHPDKYRLSVLELEQDTALISVTSSYVRLADNGSFVSHVVWPLTRWMPNSIVFRREKVLSSIGYLDNVRLGADSEFVARIRFAFGEKAHLKLKAPLTIAAHRQGSLMTSTRDGKDLFGNSWNRIRYQEKWTEWHLRLAMQGRRPYLGVGETIA